MSINYVIVEGRLGTDPELKATPSGNYVCEFKIANNESWTNKQGQKQQNTYWFSVVVWGKAGENCAKYLKKGSEAIVQGKVVTRSYSNKEGKTKKVTEIVASSVKFIGGSSEKSNSSESEPTQFKPDHSINKRDQELLDEIPF